MSEFVAHNAKIIVANNSEVSESREDPIMLYRTPIAASMCIK